ncbi:M1 family peptidase [Putridiphycobacter roseus]|uniref:M1 family peptidase n=1 Tax=Putridiphycobacter roseus TaxID=2219161 RepID=A0A2W1N2Y2_9FLAO|nr:M1 family metallopeptidase [Putridiphycobacter roseus]PZE18677.1 M1 family peptidase [Putridiphycobacter roseus]
MRKTKHFYPLVFMLFLLGSCSIFGIHFEVHNPNHSGKTPHFSKETILLGELSKYRTCFDVFYYDLALDIAPESKSLNGTVEIHAEALTDFDTLQIDLHHNFEITALVEIESKRSLKYFRQKRAVFVLLSKQKNEKFSLKIAYNGKPIKAKKAPWKGGFVWKKDKEGNHWDGVACESIGPSIWWPLKDHASDEPDSMRLHYTVPSDLMAIGNGQYKGSTTVNNKSTYNWFISYPINTYNVSLYIGKFKLIQETYKGINGKSLAISHYVLEKNYEKAKTHFKQLHKHLALYEKRFGEYPWYNDGFKLVESPYPGMEHQTAIAYGNGYKNDADFETDYIILHETAHEWWGNSVTAKDLAHVWLQEGFATYAEVLYFEEKDGHTHYKNELHYKRIFIKNKYPIVVLEGRRWFHYRKNSDVYNKGAWILHSLRTQINQDSIFFDILQTFSENNKYKIVDSDDFIHLVNEKTKDNYNWFFNHYLYNNEAPSLSYYISDQGILHYKWSNTLPEFNQLKLGLTTQNKEYTITPTHKVQQFTLPKSEDGYWHFNFSNEVLFAIIKDKSLIKA